MTYVCTYIVHLSASYAHSNACLLYSLPLSHSPSLTSDHRSPLFLFHPRLAAFRAHALQSRWYAAAGGGGRKAEERNVSRAACGRHYVRLAYAIRSCEEDQEQRGPSYTRLQAFRRFLSDFIWIIVAGCPCGANSIVVRSSLVSRGFIHFVAGVTLASNNRARAVTYTHTHAGCRLNDAARFDAKAAEKTMLYTYSRAVFLSIPLERRKLAPRRSRDRSLSLSWQTGVLSVSLFRERERDRDRERESRAETRPPPFRFQRLPTLGPLGALPPTSSPRYRCHEQQFRCYY